MHQYENFDRAFVRLPIRTENFRKRLEEDFRVRIYKGIAYEPPKDPPKGQMSFFSEGQFVFLLEDKPRSGKKRMGWAIVENASPWMGFLSVALLPKYRKKMNTDDSGKFLPKTERPIVYGKTELHIPIRKKGHPDLLVPEEILPPEPEWYVGHKWRNSIQDPKRIVIHLLREDVLQGFMSQTFRDIRGERFPFHIFDEMREEDREIYTANLLLPTPKKDAVIETTATRNPAPEPVKVPEWDGWDDLEEALGDAEEKKPEKQEEQHPQPSFGFEETPFETEKPRPVGTVDRINSLLVGLEEVSQQTKSVVAPLLDQIETQASAIANLRRELENLKGDREGIERTNLSVRRLAKLLVHNPRTPEDELKISCEKLTKAYVGRVLKDANLETNGKTLSPQERKEAAAKRRTIAGNIRREICEEVKQKNGIDITMLRQLRNQDRKEDNHVRYVDAAQDLGLLWAYYEATRNLAVGEWRLLEIPS
ncbi:MAG: hypothetical protein GF334_02675 [Candidatus Altiarchaeales archaeon]|nr:hypothetical protein [Candidatus Altiarchaeales archaeon]